MLEVHLFGAPRISNGNLVSRSRLRPTSWRLLAFLLLRAGPHSRQSVAGALWPDDPEPTALGKLRRTLYKTLQVLPRPHVAEPWCILRDSSIEWNLAADVWLDTREFERLKASPQMLGPAVDLYAADLLEGFDDEWILSERERLRGAAIAALTELVTQHRACGDLAGTLAYARRLLTLEPSREDIVRLVMAARYEMGDRAGALHEFEQFQSRLRREVGADVMQETCTLRDRIAQNEALPEVAIADAFVAPVPAGGRSTLPFTGRDAELERLMQHWSRAQSGRGSVVFVSGEAGVGKSRLVRELAGAAARSATILVGAATQLEQLPYGAFADALRPHAARIAASGISDVWLAALAWLLPDIAIARPDLPKLEPLPEGREHFRTFEAIARALQFLSAASPVLLIMEDLHWAGSSTLAALEFLARQLQAVPMMVVGTYRDEELFRAHELRGMRRRLLAEHTVVVLQLDRLSRPNIDRLLATTLRIPGTSDLPAFVHSVSDGNALIVSQLIHAFVEAGAPETARFIERSAHTLTGILTERFERLEKDSLKLIEIASVAGALFDAELLAKTAGWAENRVRSALDDLLDREIIREAGFNRYEYAFTHQLIQKIARSRMPPAELETRHRRLAHVLERLVDNPDSQAARLAAHWEMGGERDRAATWYLRAARASAACFAHAEAIRFSTKALALASDPRVQGDALLVREAASGHMGDRSAQQADLQDLERLGRSLRDHELTRETLRRGIVLNRLLGKLDFQRALITRLRRHAARPKDVRWQARAEQELANWELAAGRNEAARRLLNRASRIWREAGDIDALTQCLYVQGDLAIRTEDYEGVLRVVDELERIDLESPDPTRRARICGLGALVALRRQDMDRALALTQRGLDAYVVAGDRRGEAVSRRYLAVVLANQSRFSEVDAQLSAAEELFRMLDDPEGVSTIVHSKAFIMARLGKWEEAKEQGELALRLNEPLHSPQRIATCYLNLSYYYTRLGQLRAAKKACDRVFKLAATLNSPYHEMLAHYNVASALQKGGNLRMSLHHVESATRIARRLEQRDVFTKSLAMRAALRFELGDKAGAHRDAETAARKFNDAESDALESHATLWLIALVKHHLGEAERAVNLASRAYDLFRQRVAAIRDPDARDSFANIAFNQELIAAVERDVWSSLAQTQAY